MKIRKEETMFKLFLFYILYWIAFPVIFIIEVYCTMMKKTDCYNRVQFAIDLVFFGRPEALRWALKSQSSLETGRFTSNFYVTHNNCFGMGAIGKDYSWLVKGNVAQRRGGNKETDGGTKAVYFNVVQSVYDMYLWINIRAYNSSHPSLKCNDLIEAMLRSNGNALSSKWIQEYGQLMEDYRFNPSQKYSDNIYAVAKTTTPPKTWCTIAVMIAGLFVTGIEVILIYQGAKKLFGKRKLKKKGVQYGNK